MAILVVDDDDRIRELLARYLSENDYTVLTAKDADQAKEILSNEYIQLMILDIMLPGTSGISFTDDLRKSNNYIPILMLSALSEGEDRINGLEIGADDYLTKPFEPKELLLRIKKILERINKPTNTRKEVKFGDYVFVLNSMGLFKNGAQIPITSTEAKLLKVLAENINITISREELANQCFGISERSVDVQIVRLRSKLESDPKKPKYLLTVRNEGYGLYSDAAI